MCQALSAGGLSFPSFPFLFIFLDLLIAQRITELLLCVRHCGTELNEMRSLWLPRAPAALAFIPLVPAPQNISLPS